MYTVTYAAIARISKNGLKFFSFKLLLKKKHGKLKLLVITNLWKTLDVYQSKKLGFVYFF